MPIYEYRCIAHGHQFDLHQPVGAEPPSCPICGSPTRKVYSSVGLIFKGPGFHVTDYRRPGGSDGSKAPAEGKAAAGETKKPGGSSDSSTA
jgi:putative FmdB family regulatory protein